MNINAFNWNTGMYKHYDTFIKKSLQIYYMKC